MHSGCDYGNDTCCAQRNPVDQLPCRSPQGRGQFKCYDAHDTARLASERLIGSLGRSEGALQPASAADLPPPTRPESAQALAAAPPAAPRAPPPRVEALSRVRTVGRGMGAPPAAQLEGGTAEKDKAGEAGAGERGWGERGKTAKVPRPQRSRMTAAQPSNEAGNAAAWSVHSAARKASNSLSQAGHQDLHCDFCRTGRPLGPSFLDTAPGCNSSTTEGSLSTNALRTARTAPPAATMQSSVTIHDKSLDGEQEMQKRALHMQRHAAPAPREWGKMLGSAPGR
ncbi:unnamed protein product [Prorocentrum cordatum]|uniref:Uncharacterized protein n=2 Tax=Prorocentrum cordatum TaxID=2364126 RepID=A0ABN9XIR7_9DINO|nr:unnamed protein product [Polarella glacialis]